MKRTASLLGVITVLVLWPVVGIAGDYHHGSSLVCSDCHVMHYSQSHDYNPSGAGVFTPLGLGGPYTFLLRNDVNDLCLTCHDGDGTKPDVLGPNTATYVRQAGALNRGAVGLPETGHTLDATATAPGGGWSAGAVGLHCTNCHQPHGHNPNGNAWRNLAADPGTHGYGASFVSYATGTNADTMDVFQVATTPMTTHYATSNVFFNEPDETKSAYAFFCKGCHTNFHGDKGGAELGGDAAGEHWLRHPTNNANIGALGGGHSNYGVFSSKTNRVQVMSHSMTWPAADNTPSCMSCHKAHGNQNAFGLIFMTGTGTVTEEGDGGTQAKDLCKQCHVQG